MCHVSQGAGDHGQDGNGAHLVDPWVYCGSESILREHKMAEGTRTGHNSLEAKNM